MVITYISVVYFILSTKSNNVRSNRIIYLQQSTIDYNMFCFVLLRVQGGVGAERYVLGRKGRRLRDRIGDGDGRERVWIGKCVKGVRWSSMQAFLRSCSVTRVTVDLFFFSSRSFLPSPSNPNDKLFEIALAVLGTE